MATRRNYRDEEEYETDYEAGRQMSRRLAQRAAYNAQIQRAYGSPEPRRRNNGPAWVMAAVMICGLMLFGAWLLVDMFPKEATENPALSGAVGNQAPPERRGTMRGSDTFIPKAPQAAINDYNATAQAEYDAAVQAGGNSALVLQVATPFPLPLNSAGEPVISQAQADQQSQSLDLALDEGMTAADAQLATARNAMHTAVAVQAPDVSYEDAKALLGRDPCHVPRADPHTCDKGLYKPTPVH